MGSPKYSQIFFANAEWARPVNNFIASILKCSVIGCQFSVPERLDTFRTQPNILWIRPAFTLGGFADSFLPYEWLSQVHPKELRKRRLRGGVC
jgi:hypothetical protein